MPQVITGHRLWDNQWHDTDIGKLQVFFLASERNSTIP